MTNTLPRLACNDLLGIVPGILFVRIAEFQVDLPTFVGGGSRKSFRARYAMSRIDVAHKFEGGVHRCCANDVFVWYVAHGHGEGTIITSFYARNAPLDRTFRWNPAHIEISHASRLFIRHCAPRVIGVPLDFLAGLTKANESKNGES